MLIAGGFCKTPPAPLPFFRDTLGDILGLRWAGFRSWEVRFEPASLEEQISIGDQLNFFSVYKFKLSKWQSMGSLWLDHNKMIGKVD